MKITVPYGKDGSMSVDMDDKLAVNFLEANDVEIGNKDKCIAEGIANPINSRNFKEFLGDAKNVLVIVNDATRPTPTKKVLDFIFEDLSRVNYNVIIATGAHRGPSEEEHIQIFGSYYDKVKENVTIQFNEHQDYLMGYNLFSF